MKTCPVCNAHYEDTETVCVECYSHQILPERPQHSPHNPQIIPEETGYYQFTIDFFNDCLNLFTIIGLIATILSLFPLFVTSIFGENWFNQLLADPTIGFQSLLLILIATYFGAAFVYYLMALIIVDFVNHIRNTPNLHISEILFAFSILSLVMISIGSLILFLCLVWFNKFDLIVYFYGLYLLLLTMVPAFIIMISGIFQIYPNCLNSLISLNFKNSITSCTTNIKNYVNNRRVTIAFFSFTNWIFSRIRARRKGLMIVLFVLMTLVIISFFYLLIFNWIIPISDGISTINNEKLKYYSEKEVAVKIHYHILNQTNTSPLILSIQREIKTNSTPNWSGFDEDYAQCHWSTNFGFFVTRHPDNSIITERTQTLIVPRCIKNEDLVLWTYDLTDYNKSKPTVIIGLTFEDQNKILKTGGNGVLGKANLSASWSNFDTLRNES